MCGGAGFGVRGSRVIGAPGFCDQACVLIRVVVRLCRVPDSTGGPTPPVTLLQLPQEPPKPVAATSHLHCGLQTATL